MTNWTQEREAAARAWLESDNGAPLEISLLIRRTLNEIKRLREELRARWSHKVGCPCAPRVNTKNTNVASLHECTCGLNEALYAPEGE